MNNALCNILHNIERFFDCFWFAYTVYIYIYASIKMLFELGNPKVIAKHELLNYIMR